MANPFGEVDKLLTEYTLDNLISPVSGEVSSVFGDSRSGGRRQHVAHDYAAPAGSEYIAPAELEFIQGGTGGRNLRPNDRWAHFRIVGTPYEYRVAHIGELPEPGRIFKQGEVVGTIGKAIDSPHLHAGFYNTQTGQYEDFGPRYGLKKGSVLTAGSPMSETERTMSAVAGKINPFAEVDALIEGRAADNNPFAEVDALIQSPIPTPPKEISGIIAAGNQWAQENPEAAAMAGAPEAAWGWLNEQEDQPLTDYNKVKSKDDIPLISTSNEVKNIGSRFGFQMEPDFRETPPVMRAENVPPAPPKTIRPPRPEDEALYAAPPEQPPLGIQMAEAFGSIMPDLPPAMGGKEVVRPGSELSWRAAPEPTPKRPLPKREEVIKTVPAEISATNFVKKFATGIVGTTGGTAAGLNWLLSDTSPLLKKVQPGLKAVAESAQRYTQQIDPGEMGFAGDVVSGIGSMGVFFIPGYGGAVLTSKVAKVLTPRIANALGISVMAAGESLAEAGDAWQHARQKGLAKEQADQLANRVFTANLPLLVITERLGLFGEHGNRVRRALFSGIMEGIQETGQAIIPQVAQEEPINAKDAIYQGMIGAVIGVGAGVMTHGVGAPPQRIDQFLDSILSPSTAAKAKAGLVWEFKSQNPRVFGYSDKEIFERLSGNPKELSDILESAVQRTGPTIETALRQPSPKVQAPPAPQAEAVPAEPTTPPIPPERGVEAPRLGSESYIEAKKNPAGHYQLFYRGSTNEVFPGEKFKSANEARQYFRAMKVKEQEAQLPPERGVEGQYPSPELVKYVSAKLGISEESARNDLPQDPKDIQRKDLQNLPVIKAAKEFQRGVEAGKEGVGEAISIAVKEVNLLPHLSDNQKKELTSLINKGVTKPAIQGYLEVARELNQEKTPAPPEAKGREAGKEGWQMTRDEFLSQPHHPRAAMFHGDQFHHDWVREKLREGKPVPPEVLADYPDLQAKYGKEPTAPPEAKGREAWEMTRGEHQQSEYEKLKNQYPDAPEKDLQTTANMHVSTNRDRILMERAREGRIPDNVLDDIVERNGLGALRPFRGIYEKGAEGYLPPDVRTQEVKELPKVKEKWEKTWGEFRKDQTDAITRKLTQREFKEEKQRHHDIVAKALYENKPVPFPVLADYPDLAAKYGKAPPRAEGATGAEGKAEYSPAILQGLKDWNSGKAYVDGQGNYHIKREGYPRGPIAPWNKEVKAAFPDTGDFHKAAISKPVPASEKGAVGFDIREPQKPKDPELAAAQEKVSSRISRDEHTGKEPIKAGQIYTSLVDRLHPLKQLMDRYASKPLVVAKDIYKQARLFVGWHGKAEAFIDYHPFDRKSFEFDIEAKSLKEIIKPLEEQGKLQDFDDFLVARRALEREAKGFKTGVDLEAAQTVVNKLGPEFKEAAKDFDTYMDSLLRYMRDSQMISPERYQQIKANSLDYAPFMRLFEPEKVAGGGKGYEARQIIKAFKGSERKIISPLESAVKLTYGMINASERNQVGLSLIDWAREAGAMGKEINAISPKRFPIEVSTQEVFKDKDIRKMLEESGLSQEEATIFRPSAFRPAENVISVWENGKRKFYEVPKDVADIIQGLDQPTVDIWMRIMSAPAQALRLGATTLSPEFGLRNFFKDQFPAFIHSKYGYKPLIDFMRGVTELAKGGEDYWKYMISGAPHAELVSMDRRMLQKKLKEITSGKLTMPGFLVRHPIEAMKILSEYSEMGTRLGEFKKGMQAGEDIQEAGISARELTTDFGRRGASTKALNMLVAFWNANIQGLDRVVRAHRTNPFGTIAKAAAAITIPSLLLEMAFHDDDRYQNLPWWRKDLFYNIPTAIGVVSLPKPWTYGLLYGSIPQRIANYIMTDNPHAFDKLATAIGRELPDFPVPTGIKPFIESWANKSFFFDRPIVPTWKEQLPPKFQYGEWNSEVAKQLGRIISKIPAIGDTKAASPAVIDHFVMSWTGGAGRLALNAVDHGLRETGAVHAVPKPTRVLADYPIVRAFISRYPSADAQPIKDFYENVKEFQAKKQALNQIGETLALQGRKDELSALIKEMQPEASLSLANIQKSISSAHKYIDSVHSHPNMAPDQKRETIERTYLSIINIAKKVNMAIDKVRDQKHKLGRGQ